MEGKNVPKQKPQILFASGSGNLLSFLSYPISTATGLEVRTYYIIDEHQDVADQLQAEKNIACIVVFTDGTSDEEPSENIYAYWRKHFPTTPIIWCQDEDGYEFFGRGDWENVTWFDADQNNAFIELARLLRRYYP